MVVRSGMASGKCAVIILDVERLDEIHILAAQEFEHIGDETCSYISLRHEHTHIFIEPLRIESRTASGCLECGLVNVVIDIAVYVILLT